MDDMLDSNGSCMYCSKYLNNLNEFNKRMHRDTCKVRKLVESGNFQNANLASLAMAGGQGSSQDGGFSGSSTGGGGSSGSSSSSASSSSPSTAAAAGAGDQSANTAGSDDYIVIGENCAYCYKTFKDFKSDFNKLVHIKCCKKKREDYEKKALLAQNRAAAAAAAVAANSTGNPLAAAAAAAAALNLQSYQTASPMNSSANIFGPNTSVLSSTPQTSMGGGEACLFCNKPLANLNEFNKKMHVENCKIRKSIEGNMTPKSSRKNADDSLNKLGMELGDQCMYCCRSFANLSNFNKKLHFDHCKTKKRKLKHGTSPNNNSSQSFNQSTGSVDPNGDGSIVNLSTHSMNSSSASLINHALNFSQQHLQQQTPNHHQQQHHQQQQQQQQQQHHPKSAGNNNPNNMIDLGDNCLFCSRSLANLSNFNKKVHIETCKIKQLKKETANRLRQVNKSVKKRSPKQQQNNPNNTNNTSNNTQNNNNNNKDIKQNMNNLFHFSMMNNMDVNNDGNASTNSHLQMSQYDQLTTSLNLSGLDQSVAAIHHHHQQLQQQQQQQQQNSQNLLNPTGHLQLPMDPNVVGSVASRLFI